MTTHEMFVDREHIASLTKGSPTLAIAELIWNAWDADAKNITVKIERNGLAGIDKVSIVDDGLGLKDKDPQLLFTQIGGSWKTDAKRTPTGRPIHGQRGRGRLKALSVGNQIVWSLPDSDKSILHTVAINASTINKIDLTSNECPKEELKQSKVEITEIGDRAGELLNQEKVENILAHHFALSLKNYPQVKIKFDGHPVNPDMLIEDSTVISMPIVYENKAYNSELEIVHWKHKTDRKLYICDNKGRILQETDIKIRPGSGFNFCAYIKSDEFLETIGDSNDIIISGGLCGRILEEARERMRVYFREKKASVASELVKAWKDEGIYPYTEDTSDPVEVVRRQVFDICAYNVHEYLDGFSAADTQSRRFTFLMLNEAISEHPSALKRILQVVLKLPQDKLEDLADILEQADIGKVIEATQMAVSRLAFLDGLSTLIFNEDNAKLLGEKHNLHAMLEREPWVFGDEYGLAASEVTLTTLLKRHLPRLRPDEPISPITSTTGKSLRIDMLLGCEIGTGSKEQKEFLVIELKRPSLEISTKEKNQLDEYAFAVSEDPQFDKTKTKWTFLIIGKELHPMIERAVNQDRLPQGFWQVDTNIKVGAATWGQILTKCRSRLQWYRQALSYELAESEALEHMRKKYNSFLPEPLRRVEITSP